MDKPKISIITVSYNAAKTIEQTILSVVEQTYENIEYIIIDGGSTDGTVDIIRKYADRIAYWVSEPDEGIYDAMNKGIDVVSGEWVYFIQAGDSLRKDILLCINKYFKRLDTKFIYGNVFMRDKNKFHNGAYGKYKLMFCNICQQAIFYRRELFDYSKHNLKYKYWADWSLNIRCFGMGDLNPKYIDFVIADYEGNGCSINNKDSWFQSDKTSIIKANFGVGYYYIYIIRCLIVKKMKRFTKEIYLK